MTLLLSFVKVEQLCLNMNSSVMFWNAELASVWILFWQIFGSISHWGFCLTVNCFFFHSSKFGISDDKRLWEQSGTASWAVVGQVYFIRSVLGYLDCNEQKWMNLYRTKKEAVWTILWRNYRQFVHFKHHHQIIHIGRVSHIWNTTHGQSVNLILHKSHRQCITSTPPLN